MSNNRNNATINVGANTQEAERGINRITSQINSMNRNIASGNDPIKKLAGSWESLKNTVMSSGMALVIGKEIELLKSYIGFINDTTEAYNTQIKAEVQLETACKNNPYLNSKSVDALKNFASEIQGYTELGDEYLMPFMAKLASAGRTQEQIQEIIKASADIAASGAMSFESAVNNLNKSFSGLSGELGENVPQIKALTSEELKQGKAVEVLASQYKDMAKAVTEAAGAGTQSANVWGDLKEEIGKITKPSVDTWHRFWKSVGEAGISWIGKWNDKVKEIQRTTGYIKKVVDESVANMFKMNYKGETAIKNQSTKDLEWLSQELEWRRQNNKLSGEEVEVLADVNKELRLRKSLEEETKKISLMTNEEATAYLDKENNQLKEQSQKIAKLKDEYADLFTMIDQLNNGVNKMDSTSLSNLQNQINNYSKNGYTSSDILKRLGSLQSERSVTQSLKDTAYDKTQEPIKEQINLYETYYKKVVEAKQKEIELRKKAGEQITAEGEAQELATTKTKAYIEYLKKGGEENNAVLKEIQKTYAQLLAIDRNKKAGDAKATYKNTISAFDEEIKARRLIGEQIDDQAYKTEKLKVMESAFITMMKSAGGLLDLTNNNQEATTYYKQLLELKKEVESFSGDISEDVFDLEAEANAYLQTMGDDQVKALKSTLEYMQMLREQNFIQEEAIAQKELDLKRQLIEAEKAQGKEIANNMNNLANYLADAVNGWGDFAIQGIEADAQIETAKLEKQYEAGLIAQEDYEKQKEQIEKESAEKQYKIKLWEWGANLLQIQASTALAITNALTTTPPVLGLAMAGLISVAGAAQLASAIASKPIPPSFATGGFLLGDSTQGDKIAFRGNKGEAILNPAEQRNFMRLANGEGGGLKVEIKNYMGDSTNVSTSLNNGVLAIMINKIVKDEMGNGGYTDALTSANNMSHGISYES